MDEYITERTMDEYITERVKEAIRTHKLSLEENADRMEWDGMTTAYYNMISTFPKEALSEDTKKMISDFDAYVIKGTPLPCEVD